MRSVGQEAIPWPASEEGTTYLSPRMAHQKADNVQMKMLDTQAYGCSLNSFCQDLTGNT